MQPTIRIRNKYTQWSPLLRPRVMDVVVDSGTYYSNLTGYNSVLADTEVWLAFSKSASASVITIDKNSGDIQGADPAFYIDLSDEITEAYPASMKVYVNIDTTVLANQFIELTPTAYYPGTKQLFGFSDPVAFPNQAIKIFVI
jgi:hypothetical protein